MHTRPALRALAPVALLASLSACSTIRLDRSSVAPELAWQALDAMDMAQTVTIARQPARLAEGDSTTAAIIGRHPSERGVEAYFAVYAAAHYAVSAWLDREVDANGGGWRTVRTVWRVLTIRAAAAYVVHNAAYDVPMFGSRVRPAPLWPRCSSPVTHVPCLGTAP